MPMSYITTHIARYYYVSGTDGNAAVYVSDIDVEEKAFCIDTDHLGSITALYDQYGTKCFSASYDVWGKRTVGIDNVGFDRGFTGHEHIDEIGLINMNGRMYDPNLGRFISVDPYVQEPANLQNYNRYSYCLNNPLKYTDPSGDIFGTILGLISDVIDNIGRTFRWEEWDWTQTRMGFEIDKGLFMTDPNKCFGDRLLEFFSRVTWQLPQTIFGDLYVSINNAFEKVNNVSHGYGVTAVDMGLEYGAVTIGFYSAGPKGYKADWRDHTFVHEYGHYLQSQELGPYYLTSVALPSLQSAIIDTQENNAPPHGNRWFETDANRRAGEYFDKYYGSGRDDYNPDSENFFDIHSFCTGTESKYMNPRKNNYNKDSEGNQFISRSHWTDFIITIPGIGVIPYFLYK